MASASARFFKAARISFSIEGFSSRLYPSTTASATRRDAAFVFFTKSLLRTDRHPSSCGSRDTERKPSLSPLKMAKILCDGIGAARSLHSK